MSLSKGLDFPVVRIENKGSVTHVYIDGEDLKGVRSIQFVHDKSKSSRPVLRGDLFAERIILDTALVPELPEIYHPYYVSTTKLEEAGILAIDQLNDLLKKGLL